MAAFLRRVGALGVAGGAAAVGYSVLGQTPPPTPVQLLDHAPTRKSQIDALKNSKNEPFDILIIGGGATGCGTALDAVSRGLKTALVDREDFASGTSSRSTKLVHGGVRYLEKAFWNLDIGQLKLVFEALHERKTLLLNAPHLTNPLPTMTPCYKWWEVPYYWAGMKAYDLVAGTSGLTMSRFITSNESARLFPTLATIQASGESLKGSIVYYDGQMNDSRVCIGIAKTAALAGAKVANYTQVTSLVTGKDGKVCGAKVKDLETGKEYEIRAKAVVNCSGPFSDEIRALGDKNAQKMIMPSAGVHITLPDYYSPRNMGMIVPKTKDGRVVFMLPWLEATIAGTTDSSSDITLLPTPSEEEVQFILDAISDYLTVRVRRSDVLSAWSGIRPLAVDPTAEDTASASRDHVTIIESNNMVTAAGGKWTTYRKMAEDAVDAAITAGDLKPSRLCGTHHLPLVGARGYHSAMFTEIAQNYIVPHRPGAIDTQVAGHLATSYGDRAFSITKIAENRQLGKRLVRGHPMIEAEVVYAINEEYCRTAQDFLARRTRLAFLDTRAALEALPRVVELMAQELKWSGSRRRAEIRDAKKFLSTFQCEPKKA